VVHGGVLDGEVRENAADAIDAFVGQLNEVLLAAALGL
jgi:hypothetical protein